MYKHTKGKGKEGYCFQENGILDTLRLMLPIKQPTDAASKCDPKKCEYNNSAKTATFPRLESGDKMGSLQLSFP